MNKEIYCYNIDDMDQHILNTIAESRDIEIYLLDDGMMNKTVDQILKHQQHSNQDCTLFDSALMLMNNIDEEDSKFILDQAEAVKWGANPVRVCVNTDNRQVTLFDLLKGMPA